VKFHVSATVSKNFRDLGFTVPRPFGRDALAGRDPFDIVGQGRENGGNVARQKIGVGFLNKCDVGLSAHMRLFNQYEHPSLLDYIGQPETRH